MKQFSRLPLLSLLSASAMPFVMKIADSITVLNFGKKIADDVPEAIRRNPEVISAYLGKRGVAKDVQNAVA